EDRRLVAVLGDLEAWKGATRQLNAEQKLDASLRPSAKAGHSRLRLQRQERWDDVASRLGVRRRPAAAEHVSPGDAAIRLRILRRGEPLCGGDEMFLLGHAEQSVSIAIEEPVAQRAEGGRLPRSGVAEGLEDRARVIQAAHSFRLKKEHVPTPP